MRSNTFLLLRSAQTQRARNLVDNEAFGNLRGGGSDKTLPDRIAMKVNAESDALDAGQRPTAPHRRRTQEERSAATRGALLRAAVDIISERGWMSATTRLVAARAGVTRGALQHYFESREDLLKAVAAEIFVQLHARLDTEALSLQPLEKRVELLLQHYCGVYASPLFRAVLNAGLDPSSGVDQYMREGVTQQQEMIDRTWREVFADIDAPDFELRPLRRLVMSAIRGYAVQSLWGQDLLRSTDFALLRDLVLTQLKRINPAPR
jgi:AcrR family transcriptional regulator